MKYIGHDCNARHDPRVRKLIRKFSAMGYGIYFMANEMIGEKLDPPKIMCELEQTFEDFSDDANEAPETIQKVLDYCVEIGLMTKSGDKYQNIKVLKRKDEYTSKKIQAMSRQSPDTIPTVSGISKVKESKLKEKKENGVLKNALEHPDNVPTPPETSDEQLLNQILAKIEDQSTPDSLRIIFKKQANHLEQKILETNKLLENW